MQAELRRQRDTLAISGLAVLVLNLWGLVRSFVVSAYGSVQANASDELAAEKFEAFLAQVNINVLILFAFLLFVVMVVDFLFCIKIGVSAIAVGRGKVRRRTYLFLAVLVIIRCVASIAISVAGGAYVGMSLGVVSSIVVDVSMILALVDIIRSSEYLARSQRTRGAHLATEGR